jgi:phospholipase C
MNYAADIAQRQMGDGEHIVPELEQSRRPVAALAATVLLLLCAACDSRDDHVVKRQGCLYPAGALPAQTLAPSEPQGSAIPIDHFVIVMQENHSFDEYFQALAKRGQPAVDVAPPEFSNPDPGALGKRVIIHHATELCGTDTKHGWNPTHLQYDDGAMDGFVLTNNPNGARALAYYDDSDLPYYYALANTFAIADRYFASVPGPTWPNRMYAQAGTSFGHIANNPPPASATEHSIYDQLEDAGLSWKIYSDQRALEELIFTRLRSEKGQHFVPLAEFVKDARAGQLPAFAWVESFLSPSALGTDEHPPSDIQLGQRFVSEIIAATMASADWPKSAVFLVYDEHGGKYDHVPPPAACEPDDITPILSPGDQPGRFDRLGIRVPLIVASPFAKPHHVAHHVYSHTSLLRLVQARYDLPALTARDANDTPPYDLFDFAKPAFMTPPTLPTAVVDNAQLAACNQRFPDNNPAPPNL